MDRQQLRMMTDAALMETIKQLQHEQQRRVQQQRDDWRRDLQERLDGMFMRVGELCNLGIDVTIEIEGDGNDRIFRLTDFLKTDHADMKVVLRPIVGGD